MKKQRKLKPIFYKEVFMTVLAVLSVGLLFYEYFGNPAKQTISAIYRFDIIVALIFLFDFLYQLFGAKHKTRFLKTNWYLLLASIPIVEGWAELLRGLRVFELFRLVRAAEHLHYVESITVGSNASKKSRRNHSK